MADAEVAFGSDRVLAELIVEFHGFCSPPGVDTAAHGGYGCVLADVIYAVVKLGMGNGVEGKAFALVKWAAVVDVGSEQVVAIYVLRPVVAYARGAVVGVGVGYGIDSGVVCQAGGEVRLFLGVIGLIQEVHIVLADIFELAIACIYVERVGSILHLYEVSHIGSCLFKIVQVFYFALAVFPLIASPECRSKQKGITSCNT